MQIHTTSKALLYTSTQMTKFETMASGVHTGSRRKKKGIGMDRQRTNLYEEGDRTGGVESKEVAESLQTSRKKQRGKQTDSRHLDGRLHDETE